MSDGVVYRSPMMYSVLREGAGLVIEVVVGGFAMSAVRVRMSEAEAAAFERDASKSSDRLAAAITADPSFGGRSYPAPN